MSAANDDGEAKFKPVFVRVDLLAGENGEGEHQPVRCWGMHVPAHQDFLPIYTTDWQAVEAEMGFDGKPNGLTTKELATIVEAENDPETPAEAWVALAKRRLTE